MFNIRRANERGYGDHGWLKSWHTFSFAGYHDPRHVQFRALRVMNEDRVAPGQGFGTHSHSDMEILTYVLSGALQHKDSMGNGEVLRPGEFQRMTAGTGLTHSEFNASAVEPVHFYQIWLIPERKGLIPDYEQKAFAFDGGDHTLRLVASPSAADGSLLVHADARVYLGRLNSGRPIGFEIEATRHVWVQVITGEVDVNGHSLVTSDGIAISNETHLSITSQTASEIMLFDLG